MPAQISDQAVEVLVNIANYALMRVPSQIGALGAQIATLTKKVNIMSGNTTDLTTQFNQELESLRNDVEAQTSEVASVRVAFNGIGKQLADALAQAKAAGANDAQLAAVQAVHQSILANTQGLVEAVGANTPSEGQTGTAPDAASATVSGGADASAQDTTGSVVEGAVTTPGGTDTTATDAPAAQPKPTFS